jgi:ABC-type nitrate/sulfonate/bicarbonate transport system substrate-binding protein
VKRRSITSLILFRLLLPLLCALGVAAPAAAQQRDKIRLAAQVWYPSFPMYAAMTQGIYAKWGLEPTMAVYPSGGPIVQAAATGEWDVAHIGLPPTVQGYKLGLIIAGVISEEAVIHQLIGRPDYVKSVKGNPARLKGAKVFVTTGSTGHFMVEGCLKKHGLGMSDVQLLPSEQAASLSAFMAGNGDLAQLWTPQSTAARGRGMEVFCDATAAGVQVPSVWVIHPDFAKKNPDAALRWLRATLEGVSWAQQDRARTTALYRQWDKYRGTQTDETFLKEEIDLAMDLWPMKEQLPRMTGAPGEKVYVYRVLDEISRFYTRIGRMKEVAPEILKMPDPTWIQKAAALPPR